MAVGTKSPQNPASSVAGPPNYLDAPVVGIEVDYARSDHSHGLPAATGGSGTPSTTVTGPDAFGAVAVVGVQANYSRGDHDHGLPSLPAIPAIATAVVGPGTFSSAAVLGTDNTHFAKADHYHGLPAAPAGTSASATVTGPDTFGDSSAPGISANFSRGDHDHGLPNLPASGTPATTVTSDTSFNQPAAVGILTSYAREDHDHGLPSLTNPVIFPSAGAIYGSAMSGETLANTTIDGGNLHAARVYTRFRAEVSDTFKTFRIYALRDFHDGSGYAGGTGGTWKAEVFADDGTANHFPTGAALATQNVAASAVDNAGLLITFATPAALTIGTLYHLVFTNTDASPGTNYWAPDNWYSQQATNANPDGRTWPRFTPTDWEHGYNNSMSGGTWVKRTGFSPILDIGYTGGHHQGQSYGEASSTTGPPSGVGFITGTNNQVRERFTPSSTVVVTAISFKLMRTTGGNALNITLEDDTGSIIETVSVSNSSIALGVVPSGQDIGASRWITVPFSTAHTLTGGTTYRIRWTSGGSAVFYMFVMRRLSVDYGYDPATTAFNDGHAEFTTNGSTWTSLGRVASENDVMFYFSTPAGGGGSSLPIGAINIITGSGSPTGVVAATPGSIYLRTDGGAGTSFYVKESASDTSGWVAK